MFQPIEMAQYNYNPQQYPQPGQPAQMPRPGLPGQMPQQGMPAQYPSFGAPAEMPKEGRPSEQASIQPPEYHYIGDPIVDKYIHSFIGVA